MLIFNSNFLNNSGLYLLLFFLMVASSEAADLDCLIKPEMYIELSSPVAGVLDKLLVNKGDHVTNGQAVAQLENSVEIAKVNQAKFEAGNNGELNNRKAQLAFALRNRTRSQDLYQKGTLSKTEKDKAETEVVLAETQLAKAEEQKKAAALALELAKVQLALKTIKSPIDGIVIDRYAMIGESVNDRAIMKLAQVDPLRIELVASTEYFGLIKEGMQAKVHTERPTNKTVTATVAFVDQLIDPASGSFSVRMSLPNPDDQLIGGVNCIASFSFDLPASSNSSANPPPDNMSEISTPKQGDEPVK
jgi:RND family efflux transporter MFP subunit